MHWVIVPGEIIRNVRSYPAVIKIGLKARLGACITQVLDVTPGAQQGFSLPVGRFLLSLHLLPTVKVFPLVWICRRILKVKGLFIFLARVLGKLVPQ